MKITEKLFEAYLKCPLKCFLLSANEPMTPGLYAAWVRGQNDSYRNCQANRLAAEVLPNECIISPQRIEDVRGARWRLAINVTIREKNLQSNIHAVRKIPPMGRGRRRQFIPVRLIVRNKLTRDDKLLLAFDAHVLSEHLGRPIARGPLVHGDNGTTVSVNIAILLKTVRQVTSRIAKVLSTDSPPDLVLNRHCVECEFQPTCNRKAKEKDDLSLMSGILEKERKNLNKKGIFTVTHLSYMFRPRRKSKRSSDKGDRFTLTWRESPTGISIT
ncbi:MAG: Dna2/Cas4 domain-containing protein [Nitrospirae bacterium]|nr:Dna2/Cas4 domain-containing protein [Nitrospirota bacterium]